jgi:hypothetical protein
MCNGNIGFDLSFDSGSLKESELFKDVFYSFILSTSEATDDFIDFLKNHFGSSAVEVRKIGETKAETVKLVGTSINLKQFQEKFHRELEMVNL